MVTFPVWVGGILVAVCCVGLAWRAGDEIAEHRARSQRYQNRPRLWLVIAAREHSRLVAPAKRTRS